MQLRERRSFLGSVVLLLGLVLAPLADARSEQKATVLRAEFVGLGSTQIVIDYRITGDHRVLSTKLVDVPLEEVTVVVGDARFEVTLDAEDDAVVVFDNEDGDAVPVLKAGAMVAVLTEVRGSLRVLAKGVLKPAN